MADLSIFKLDSETITIKDSVARQTADSAKTLATTASGNATTALNKMNELESEISALKSDLANKLYPVGSIYMSVNATNPSALFGGTWEQIKGRFLIGTGANDANTTDYWGHEDANNHNMPAGELGGESQHTLTVDEMPFHTHVTRLDWNNTKGWGIATSESGDTNATVDAGTKTGAAGGGKPHNNMPPYLAVYMWKRIA